ncbi:hypothetical protein TRVL_07265 [Trypanosoma vivax]|nr:hypothetical protein TRVL_07265 [Trypanosoma vivax]
MGLAPSRSLLYSDRDAPLWVVSTLPKSLNSICPMQRPGNISSEVSDAVCSPLSPSRLELRLVPLIRRYFPSADCVLFKQLMHSRSRQNPRYHFYCSQRPPPTALVDPTAYYFDLQEENGEGTVEEEKTVTALGGNKVTSTFFAPFHSPQLLYDLLVECTERNIFDDDEALSCALRSDVDEDECCCTCFLGSADSDAKLNFVGRSHGKCCRVRPVPCAIMLLRHSGTSAITDRHDVMSFGLAKAVEAVHQPTPCSIYHPASDNPNPAYVEEGVDGSWIVWKNNNELIKGRVCGFYGCWTLGELLSHSGHCGTTSLGIPSASCTDPILHPSYSQSTEGAFGLTRDRLIASGTVDYEVGEREQTHAWVAACRAFAHTITTSYVPRRNGTDGSNVSRLDAHPDAEQTSHLLVPHPLTCLRRLDITFICPMSNAPRLQLCRQMRLFADIVEEVSDDNLAVSDLQRFLRKQASNCSVADRQMPVGSGSLESCTQFGHSTTIFENGSNPNEVKLFTSETGAPSRLNFDNFPLASDAVSSAGYENLVLAPLLRATQLRERGAYSYFCDGAVVQCFSSTKTVDALMKLLSLPLSESTENLMARLTPRAPPPLKYCGELCARVSGSPVDEKEQDVSFSPNRRSSVCRRIVGSPRCIRLASWKGLSLPREVANSANVFAVGQGLDGMPASALLDAFSSDECTMTPNCKTSINLFTASSASSLGSSPIPPVSNGLQKSPDTKVHFGDLIRYDRAAGCWYVDSNLSAVDVAVAWIRRVAGRARGAKASDAHWLRGSLRRIDANGAVSDVFPRAQINGFRLWHAQHDGYSYFHGVQERCSVVPEKCFHTFKAAVEEVKAFNISPARVRSQECLEMFEVESIKRDSYSQAAALFRHSSSRSDGGAVLLSSVPPLARRSACLLDSFGRSFRWNPYGKQPSLPGERIG